MSFKLRRIFSIFAFVMMSMFLVMLVSSRASERSALGYQGALAAGLQQGVDNDTENISQTDVTPTPSLTPAPTVYKPDIDVSSWEYVLCNEDHNIGSYAPPEVVTVDGTAQYCDSRVLEPLKAFLKAIEDAGFTPCLQKGYVPFSTQNYRFNGKASQISWDGTYTYEEAVEMTKEIIAYPGTSDHQTGLGFDITDKFYNTLDVETIDQTLMDWLKENCAPYGFIPRYPSSKSGITGWDEPWHYRYVGKEVAEYIMDNNLCLEQFYELYQ